MKKLALMFLLVVALLTVTFLPAQARVSGRTSNITPTVTFSASSDVRYVRVRGKRYKVWYKTYYKGGRRYYRITRIRRA